MLRECGLTTATTSDGRGFTFRPSFGRIAALGHPHEIVALYADLHGPRAEIEARYVLAALCDQDDPLPLIGWRDERGNHPGEMPATEQVIIARHLMQHGMVGSARPGRPGDGRYSATFDASEYVTAARVHLGLSSEDAEALSMTEFQQLFEAKFPRKGGDKDLPSAEEYEASMKALEESRRG